MPREGILIDTPLERLSHEQVERIHRASMEILSDPGLLCYNREAADIFSQGGADVSAVEPSEHPCWLIRCYKQNPAALRTQNRKRNLVKKCLFVRSSNPS